MSFKNKENKTNKNVSDPGLNSLAEEKILARAEKNRLSCADSFRLANELSISKEEIGMFADCYDIRLEQCQLGLFGVGPGKKKAVEKLESVPEELEKLITDALDEGRLSCRDAWEIASRLNIGKMTVSSACDFLKVRIKTCRLGAF